MKIALVCDDLVQFGGQERLVMEAHEIWPHAPLYTTVASKKWIKICKDRGISLKVSYMQKLPLIERLNRYYAPLLMHIVAFENFDFSEFDVVLSFSSRFAHGVVTKPGTKHICYMNSPGRMFWEPDTYFGNKLKVTLSMFLSNIRLWDYTAAQRVDFFVANSKTPQARIKKYYNQNSVIIYPFVDLSSFRGQQGVSGEYFLVVSRLLFWKKIDVVVKAFNTLNLPLKIVGEGPDFQRLKSMSNSNIEFLGYVGGTRKTELFANCKAVINPQHEDFGIVPLEAMACGKPTIAFGGGGALETIIEGDTGTFFYAQTPDAIIDKVKEFDSKDYSEFLCIKQARKFDKSFFRRNLSAFVNDVYLSNNPYSV